MTQQPVFLMLVALLGAASPVSAQSPVDPLWSTDSIQSKILGEVRQLRISLPILYGDPISVAEHYPVLIVLDAGSPTQWPAIAANARAMAHPLSPAIPPMIVVGVETSVHRYRDMTLPPLDGPAKDEEGIGGAPKFADFLTTELLPYLASQFRTMPFTVVAGHSMTGLFAAYAYGYNPTSINAIIALSPSLSWNGNLAYREVLQGVKARTTPGRFFFAASREEGGDISSSSRRLAADLKGRSGATVVGYRELRFESHASIRMQGMIDGLKFIFEPLALAGAAIEAAPDARGLAKAFAEAKQRYLAGARTLGFPERLPLVFVFGYTEWMVVEPHAVAAVPALCDEIVRSYPAAWHGSVCRARVAFEAKDLALAEKLFRDALRLAQESNDSVGIRRGENGLRFVAQAREKKPEEWPD